MTDRAPARDRDAERAQARRPESCSTSVSSRPSRRPAADRRAGRASWLRTTACGARRQAMSEVLRRGGRDECDVCVSRAATAPSHGPGSSGEGRAPPRAVRVSRPRAWPSPHVPGLPAAPRTARVQSSPASRNPSAPIPLRGQQRSPRRAYSCTCACGPVEDIRRPTEVVAEYDIGALRRAAMSAATSISWRASSPIIRGPRRPSDGPKWRCIRGSIDWPPNGAQRRWYAVCRRKYAPSGARDATDGGCSTLRSASHCTV
jgi:hypothetical protein